ncbi:uncharacterized protein OCT59_021531 [Rhizophagus irregularis]|uniref:uncharacterized protein n=1 Tax=Rhizophagus irregularis TaxID=588596 RepID=UPI00331A1055|nr:hypothetical protein OCT59_021531 [Rhizophagus irregularis]
MRVLEKVGSQKTGISKNMRLIDQTPEVVKWYNTERMRTLPKPMQVLLLELCQKYGFSYPRFHQKSGSNNKLTYITCKVNQKSWEPDTSFSKRSDAKDHINVPSLKGETKYIILLHDAAKKKHWPINYEYHSRNGGN